MDLFDNTPTLVPQTANIISQHSTHIMEKKVHKLRRSCEVCRNSKGRCCPSKEGDRCQRCAREGHPCIFLEAKPRPKRAKNSRIRVAEMEEKLDGLVALLANVREGVTVAGSLPGDVRGVPVETSSEDSAITSFLELPSAQGSELSSQFLSQFPQNTEPRPFAVPLQCSIFPFPDYVFNELQDPISKNIVSFDQAEKLLKDFRMQESSFPWVHLPKHTSLDTLRRERPFLTLGILTFAAQYNLNTQEQLETELKASLMTKFLVQGEKSLDLLQGLLVYLSWYHLYFKPGQEQMYQLCQMAVSMSVDLGINKSDPELQSREMLSLTHTPYLPTGPRYSPEDLERRRTYLACYYIVASVCQDLRKPANIKFTDHTEDCCKVIEQATEYDSDRLIPCFVRLQKLSGDVYLAFDYDGEAALLELDTIRIEVLVKAFHDQLIQLERSFPTEVWENASINMAFHAQRIVINEIGFHAKRPTLDTMSTPAANRSWYFAVNRNEYLIRALHAAKDFLDYFLGISPEQIHNFILPDWTRILYAILIVGAFKSQLDVPTLDLQYARAIADVQEYLCAMITKIGAFAPSPTETGQNHYLSHIIALFVHYKSHFQEVQRNSEMGKGIVSFPDFFILGMMAVKETKRLEWEIPLLQSTSEQPSPSTEGWEEILSNWPNSMDPSIMPIDSSI